MFPSQVPSCSPFSRQRSWTGVYMLPESCRPGIVALHFLCRATHVYRQFRKCARNPNGRLSYVLSRCSPSDVEGCDAVVSLWRVSLNAVLGASRTPPFHPAISIRETVYIPLHAF